MGISSIGPTCAHMRSHVRILNVPRVVTPCMARYELPTTTALRPVARAKYRTRYRTAYSNRHSQTAARRPYVVDQCPGPRIGGNRDPGFC